MLKLLLLVVGIWLIYTLLRTYGRSIRKDDSAPAPRTEEDMVRCAQCGVHLPRSESIVSQGQFYCSDDHRRQHQG